MSLKVLGKDAPAGIGGRSELTSHTRQQGQKEFQQSIWIETQNASVSSNSSEHPFASYSFPWGCQPSLLRYFTKDLPPPGPGRTVSPPCSSFSDSRPFSYLQFLTLDAYYLPPHLLHLSTTQSNTSPCCLKNLTVIFPNTTHAIIVISIIHSWFFHFFTFHSFSKVGEDKVLNNVCSW